MKKIILISFIALFICCLNSFSQNLDTNTIMGNKGYDFLISGGIGITDRSITRRSWHLFVPGYAASIGFELPFTKSHLVSIELNSHILIAKEKDNGYLADNDVGIYSKLSDNFNSAYGTSLLFKFYTANSDSDFRLAFIIGKLLIGQDKLYYDHSFDFGVELHYKINENLSLALSQRLFLTEFPINLGDGGSTNYNIDFITLNVLFKQNW